MNKIAPIHPGEILSEDFLKPMGISGYKLAKALLIDQTRVSEIIKGKRSITIDTALRLAKSFRTNAIKTYATFWFTCTNGTVFC